LTFGYNFNHENNPNSLSKDSAETIMSILKNRYEYEMKQIEGLSWNLPWNLTNIIKSKDLIEIERFFKCLE